MEWSSSLDIKNKQWIWEGTGGQCKHAWYSIGGYSSSADIIDAFVYSDGNGRWTLISTRLFKCYDRLEP